MIADGVLAPLTINSGGVGYSSAPDITIPGPIDPNSPFAMPAVNAAKATAVITATGILTATKYENAGANYHLIGSDPAITVESPVGISTGDYEFNEVVTGSTTGTTAHVKGWDYDTRTLKVSIISGNFALGEAIVGAAGGYKFISIPMTYMMDLQKMMSLNLRQIKYSISQKGTHSGTLNNIHATVLLCLEHTLYHEIIKRTIIAFWYFIQQSLHKT